MPVVAISQLNRGSEQRTDKTPQLSDLRESGSIEQDADIVMLLNRPDAHGHGESDRQGEADIIVAKNRSGPVNRVAVELPGPLLALHAHGRSPSRPRRRRRRLLRMTVPPSGRRLLIATFVLIDVHVIGGFLAVASDVNTWEKPGVRRPCSPHRCR